MIKKNLEEYKGITIYAQQVDGKLSPIALELLGKARELAESLDDKTVTAVLIGSDVGGLANELAAYGADRVVVIDDPSTVILNILSADKKVSVFPQYSFGMLFFIVIFSPDRLVSL